MHVADLVENALRAGAKHIKITVKRQGDRLVLEVADDGVGMTQDELPWAVEPFYTTKDRPHGIGLGLALVGQTADELGGRLEVDSEPDRGTRVRLEIPYDHPDRPPLGDLAEAVVPLMATSDGVEFTLLLGDDHRTWKLDTREVRDHLEGGPLVHPEVLSFLEQYVREGMKLTGLKEDG